MANTQALKRRIRSVGNTRQITKAMELVSASKMRRAAETTQKSRAYSNTARDILVRLSELTDVRKHPLFVKRAVKARLYIVITADRGLAGAYSSNLFRRLVREISDDKTNHIASKVIVSGKQGGRFLARIEGVDVIGAYPALPDHPSEQDVRVILETALNLFQKKEVDAVDVLFTDYRSSINQVVELRRLLPAAFERTSISHDLDSAMVEPTPEAVLNAVAERFVAVQLWQSLLEGQASEHSMRMLAMKSASDNAAEIIDDLTLDMNKARQASITQELAEITGGAEAMKDE